MGNEGCRRGVGRGGQGGRAHVGRGCGGKWGEVMGWEGGWHENGVVDGVMRGDGDGGGGVGWLVALA